MFLRRKSIEFFNFLLSFAFTLSTNGQKEAYTAKIQECHAESTELFMIAP